MKKASPPKRGRLSVFSLRNQALVTDPNPAPTRTVIGPDFLTHDVTAAVGIRATVIGVTRRVAIVIAVAVTVTRGDCRSDDGASRQAADDARRDRARIIARLRRRRGNHRRRGNRAGGGKSGESFHHDVTSSVKARSPWKRARDRKTTLPEAKS